MLQLKQLSLLDEGEIQSKDNDWTFSGAPTRELTHCYHDYPARMIPQIAGKLLNLYAGKANLLFDPYCGTGTSLVEGMIRGIDVVGTDLNPLARLIAKAKTTIPNLDELDKHISCLNKLVLRTKIDSVVKPSIIHGISNLDFWFKPSVIKKLLILKTFFEGIKNEAIKLFFQVAFSETVRECSNTRSGEFKLYRYSEEKLQIFDPNVFAVMALKLKRNRTGLLQFAALIKKVNKNHNATIYDFNTVAGIPIDTIIPESVNIVITSPPYGDSHTTVAYGQYSRLSAAWLGMSDPGKIDNKLMGGRIKKILDSFPSDFLNTALNNILTIDRKRALEVGSFYADLGASISNVSTLIRPGGYACYVVGNRKVKGIVLPTDEAVRRFFENSGFKHVETYIRSIPNKRMPMKNSPSNVPGILDNTMTREYIVVMQRKRVRALRSTVVSHKRPRNHRP